MWHLLTIHWSWKNQLYESFCIKNNWNKMILHLSNSLLYLRYCWPNLTKGSAGHMGELNMWSKSVSSIFYGRTITISHKTVSFIHIEGEQNFPFPDMSLWHKDYFKLVIFKTLQTQEKLWKPSKSYPSVRNIYIFKEEICKGAFLSIPGSGGWEKISRNLSMVKATI